MTYYVTGAGEDEGVPIASAAELESLRAILAVNSERVNGEQ